MGIPDEQIKLKLKKEKTKLEVLDHSDRVSPNDHGVSCGIWTIAWYRLRSDLVVAFAYQEQEARDWFFSEEERLDANKTYGRLWRLSFLERDAGQLIAKRAHIFNAPAAMRVMARVKRNRSADSIPATEGYVFKSSSYTTEVRLLQQFSITERFEEEEDDVL
ncbi:hypothetical protein DD238_001114 [Peronospora effusa]|uniref:Uncharacterized protein n=1 Tax=Peronospora effusa TaxID=542832 RepID=A0A3M6VM70_9STRA|nr:hypothetical protein DD238_001114 [Peronospora effusa]RQM13842.1 hypothetical protein DD237_001996 [Peronospora effusa]